jgi:hypothetical protein
MHGGISIGLVCLALLLPVQAFAQAEPAASSPETREMLEAAKATAKATRENLEYARVVPDMLFQILAKLDKIEDKLDKVENAIKRDTAARARGR